MSEFERHPGPVSIAATHSGRAWLELMAMTSLLLSFLWLWRRQFPGDDALLATLVLVLVLGAHLARRETPRDIGFRLDNLPLALSTVLVYLGPLIVIPPLIGLVLGSLHFPDAPRGVTSLFAGTVSGTLQQYALLGFYYRRFTDALAAPGPAVLATAFTFALFHIPNPFLTLVTFPTGVVACLLYRRVPNLWAIGFGHALVSFALYYSLPRELTFGFQVGPSFLANWG